ncbi:MAG: uracil-DNA glycosylase [Gammaproteobacteria bacterium]|nr:uracil-DNA glycosylase [Gammaproteobacteria bacterium]
MSDARRLQYLEAMGIQAWAERGAAPAAAGVAEAPGAIAEPAPVSFSTESSIEAGDSDVARLDWDALQARVKGCTLCGLEKTRTQTVFGVGNRSAAWMVVGEAPGADEDRQGEPFVGRAGQLLNEMLWALGLERAEVYIANVLKCRPPGNRDPSPNEVACCEPYLKRQVALIKPKIILAVGRIAAQNLLKTDTRIGALRGRVHRYADTGIPLVVTYHPAYLLRSPLEKRKSWDDLQLAARTFGGGAG